MCLAIPGKLISAEVSNGVRVGQVEFGSVVRTACLDFVPDAQPGDYVTVHVGFAINRVAREEAENTLCALKEVEKLKANFS